MNPTRPQDWISSVTRPLRDKPYLEQTARHELTEQAAQADPGQLATLAERFDEIDRTPVAERRILYWLPIVTAFVIALACGIPTFLRYNSVRKFLTSMEGSSSASTSTSPADRLVNQLTPEEYFYVFGDTSQPTDELSARELWAFYPEDPALFGDYLAHCDTFPPHFVETANRIDPDNGWFLFLAGGEHGKMFVEKQKRPFKGDPEYKPTTGDWKISNHEVLKEAVDLLTQAAEKPRLEYYGGQVLKRRLAILPPEADFLSRTMRVVEAASTPTKDVFKVLGSASVLSAEAFRLGEKKDAEELREFIPVAETLCRRLVEQDGGLTYQLVALATSISVYEHLLEACEWCDLTAEAARLQPKVLELRKLRKKKMKSSPAKSDPIRKHGSVFASFTATSALDRFDVPGPTMEELKPGRLMNYALADRVFAWAAAKLTLLGILVVLALRLGGSRLGRRLAQLPNWRDWLWIVSLGALAPLLWLLAVTRVTPLGCRDWGITYFTFQPFTTQYLIGFVLVLSASLWTAQWRLGRHAGSLGYAMPRPGAHLLPSLVLALTIPFAGCIRYASSTWPLYTAIGLAGIAALWLPCRFLIGPRRTAPFRTATASLLAPAYALFALVLLSLVPVTAHLELYWISRDDLMRTSPENYGMNKLERDVANHLQAKLQAALEES